MEALFLKAKKLVEESQNILLAAHNDPDGDAFGSLLALNAALEKAGKKVSVFAEPPFPVCFYFLPGFKKITDNVDWPKIDLIIGLDYGDPKRLRLNLRLTKSPKFLTFDHHTTGQPLGLAIVNSEISSTAELIYQYFCATETHINNDIATCLLTGIFSDTGGFHHVNTSAQTLRIVAKLLLKGAPLQKIAKAENSHYCYFPDAARFWTAAFKNLKIDLESGFAFSLILRRDYPDFGTEWKSSAMTSLLSTVPEIKIALLCAEKKPGQIECSLRSQSGRGVDVAAIARLFGGGGHRLAAGFQTNEPPEIIVDKIKNLAAENFSS